MGTIELLAYREPPPLRKGTTLRGENSTDGVDRRIRMVGWKDI
jgi:hypothetical protein